ncbi:cyanase [Microbulbifer sp.]|uniref:cyanase n=1 Tax=Microbulbifer sp. TaxID=1908541 RepID=UPI003F2DE73F
MKKYDVTEAIILAKKSRDLTWEAIASEIGMSPVWTTSVCLGMNSAPEPQAEALCKLFDLPTGSKEVLMECPTKSWEPAIPQDPLIYRLYEAIGVYGPTMKEIIHEKFGDGIMSAIDFSMSIDKEENPKGDRVVITWNGKFLPYKQW